VADCIPPPGPRSCGASHTEVSRRSVPWKPTIGKVLGDREQKRGSGPEEVAGLRRLGADDGIRTGTLTLGIATSSCRPVLSRPFVLVTPPRGSRSRVPADPIAVG
jgi:hypothetical protein